MNAKELEKIATKAGWTFPTHETLIFTALPPEDTQAAIHAEIATWVDKILAAKAENAYSDRIDDLWHETGQSADFEDTLRNVCLNRKADLVPDRVRRNAGMLGHSLDLDPATGAMLVLTQAHTQGQRCPEFILYHHDAMHLELLRSYFAAINAGSLADDLKSQLAKDAA